MSMPILQVVQISTLKVVANISEQFFPEVRIGTAVNVAVDLFPDKLFSGRVSLIHPVIDPASRTFGIEVTIPNGNGELRPGMFSRSTIIFGKSEGVMVEDVAVQRQAGTNERYLFVAEHGRAVRRIVTVGRQIGDRINILSGVEAGEEVIVAGLSQLMDGSEIEIRN
jgi:RND family efflux transporter MFP subunit